MPFAIGQNRCASCGSCFLFLQPNMLWSQFAHPFLHSKHTRSCGLGSSLKTFDYYHASQLLKDGNI